MYTDLDKLQQILTCTLYLIYGGQTVPFPLPMSIYKYKNITQTDIWGEKNSIKKEKTKNIRTAWK